MITILKKIGLYFLIFFSGLILNPERLHAQSLKVQDSLTQLLKYFKDNTADEKIKKVIMEIDGEFTNFTINESLSNKLLTLDSLITDATQIDPQKILSYTSFVISILNKLPPRGGHPHYVSSLRLLGNLYYSMQQNDNALPLFQEALAIRKKTIGSEHPDYAVSLYELGFIYWQMGLYEEALPLLQQNLIIRERTAGDNPLDYSESLNNLGMLYKDMGSFDKALPLSEMAVIIRKKAQGNEHPDYALFLENLASVYKALGQYEKALLYWKQAIGIIKTAYGETAPEYATSLQNIATLYSKMGQYEKALPLLQQALVITKKAFSENHIVYIKNLNNLAILYKDIGQYEKAMLLSEQVLATMKKKQGNEHLLYGVFLDNLGSIYKAMGLYEKALSSSLQSLEIIKKTLGEEHPEYANTLQNITALYHSMRKYEKEQPILKQALAIIKTALGSEHPEYARCLQNLASLYEKMREYEKALPLLLEALAIRKKTLGEEHPLYANSLNSLGWLYSISGNNQAASDYLVKANILKLQHLNRSFSTLSEQEKLTFLNKESFQFNYLSSILYNTKAANPQMIKQVYDNELRLKGMILQDQLNVLNGIRKSKDNSAMQLYAQWQTNRAFLGQQFLLSVKKRVPYLDSLQDATIKMEQQLSQISISFRNQLQGQNLTVKELGHKLSKGHAAIEFIRFTVYPKEKPERIQYAAMVLLPGDSIPKFIPLFEEKELQLVLRSSNTPTSIYKLYPAASVSKNKANSLTGSLYGLIWNPLEKYLAGINTVYYSPAGLLNRVAFQAVGPDHTHLLIDKYQLNQVLSTRSVIFPAQISSVPSSAAVWGDIQYSADKTPGNQMASRGQNLADTAQNVGDTTSFSFNFLAWDTRAARNEGWNPLPGTKREIDSLKNLLLTNNISFKAYTTEDATEEVFKSFDGRSPELLHLATHGFFLPGAGAKKKKNDRKDDNVFTLPGKSMFRSGLVLAKGNYAWKGGSAIAGTEDGILTAYEISLMDLSNTELVVLSACETALGDLEGNEGVIGLQRAFKMAGVKQMILSLWRIPDKETTELMTLFYKNWLGGQNTREALRSAQQKMKKRYSPYYWAGFVLIE